MTVSIHSLSRKVGTINASFDDLTALFGQPSLLHQDKISCLFEAQFLDLELHLDYFVNNPTNDELVQNPDNIYTWSISSSDNLAPDRLQNFINFVNNAWTNPNKYSPASTLRVNIDKYLKMG